MALAEVLRITHSVRDEVKVVGGKMESMGDKVQSVDEKVQVVIDSARDVSNQSPTPANIYAFRWQGGKSGGEGSKIDYLAVINQRR